MMGAGKSTIGPMLARRLGKRFIDTDAEVERTAGRRVSEIFQRDGEPAFRKLEREAIEACAGEDAVVALGGGAVEAPGARQRLASTGTVIYLRARLPTLLARVRDGGGRPLLADLLPKAQSERLLELLARRRDAYESASIVIDTDELAPDSVAEVLAERISKSARRAREGRGDGRRAAARPPGPEDWEEG
jgi:shikimate kinase